MYCIDDVLYKIKIDECMYLISLFVIIVNIAAKTNESNIIRIFLLSLFSELIILLLLYAIIIGD